MFQIGDQLPHPTSKFLQKLSPLPKDKFLAPKYLTKRPSQPIIDQTTLTKYSWLHTCPHKHWWDKPTKISYQIKLKHHINTQVINLDFQIGTKIEWFYCLNILSVSFLSSSLFWTFSLPTFCFIISPLDCPQLPFQPQNQRNKQVIQQKEQE